MRRTTAAAFVLAAALGLTACSSDDSAEDAAGDTDTSASAAASDTPSAESSPSTEAGGDDIAPDEIAGLALGEGDFPAPYQYTELPPGALEKSGEALGGAFEGATFDPAECGGAVTAASFADLSQAGVAVATDETTGASVVEVVSPASAEVPDFAALSDACSTFTFTLDSPAGKLEGTASVEVLPEPDVDADRAQAARTTVDITVAGKVQTVVTTIYSAELRGVAVNVTGTAPSGGADIDTAVLDQLLEAGVAKVAAA